VPLSCRRWRICFTPGIPVYYTQNLHKIILSGEQVALDMTRRHYWNPQHNWLPGERVSVRASGSGGSGGGAVVGACSVLLWWPTGWHGSQNGHLLAHAFGLNASTCVSGWSNQQVKFTKVRWHNWVDSLTIYWFSIQQSWPAECMQCVHNGYTCRFSCYNM